MSEYLDDVEKVFRWADRGVQLIKKAYDQLIFFHEALTRNESRIPQGLVLCGMTDDPRKLQAASASLCEHGQTCPGAMDYLGDILNQELATPNHTDCGDINTTTALQAVTFWVDEVYVAVLRSCLWLDKLKNDAPAPNWGNKRMSEQEYLRYVGACNDSISAIYFVTSDSIKKLGATLSFEGVKLANWQRNATAGAAYEGELQFESVAAEATVIQPKKPKKAKKPANLKRDELFHKLYVDYTAKQIMAMWNAKHFGEDQVGEWTVSKAIQRHQDRLDKLDT